jgi:galactokinase
LTGSGSSARFADIFGTEPTVRASAPGRVNVIGEHTDYNGGFVLPATIPQHTAVELRRHQSDDVEVWSRDVAPGGERNGYTLGHETPQHDWLDYVRGVTQVLATDGHRLTGFQLRIESDVPLGSGLSSSAALEIAVLRALRSAFQLELSDTDLALIGQRVENDFVGAPVGIMDQMASSVAGDGYMLFLDTRSLAHERIPLPESSGLIVINSGVAHSHAGGDYRTRRAECRQAATLLGVSELRDLGVSDLPRVAQLPAPLDRRARHVITENQRVLDAVAAFRAEDLDGAGALMSASHASMRDDFEVSIPEIDLLVSIAARHSGIYGARLTGGGFGGSIVALAPQASARRSAELITAEYREKSGRTGHVLVPASSAV